MKYSDFEKIISPGRMLRYVNACRGNTKKAMTLYRYNLRLSQEVFTVISCYEVALRNAIDSNLSHINGPDWLRDAILPGGMFDAPKFSRTAGIIRWKYMFSNTQFRVTGRTLLGIFPNKPKSSRNRQYNNLFVFNELDAVNRLRNRIAHHEPICFLQNAEKISTEYLRSCYSRIITLFAWMGIQSDKLLFGIDHVLPLCETIEAL